MDNLAITYQHIADILGFETPNAQLEKTLSQQSFNWDPIVIQGSRHLVLPAIYCRLKTKQLLHVLPEDLNTYLEEISTLNRQRNEVILKQVHALTQLFNKHNIEHVFLKGAALLALDCFNDNAERMIGDIDVLVTSKQLNEAYNLLCDNGYKPMAQTLGNDFFEHKHLPRLETELSDNHIAAVEVHRKLFVNYTYNDLEPESIFKIKKQHNAVSIPTIKHLLMHNILNYQINDQGALYNSISFRSAFDTIVLQKLYSGTTKWYKTKMFKKYFKYNSLFFKEIKVITNVKTDIFTYFYLYKLKHFKVNNFWNKLLKLISFIPILLKRLRFFISNKAYRKAVIRDKNRIFEHLKSILDNF